MSKLRSPIRRPSPSLVIALLALIVAASGAAFAAIPRADGNIDACYNTNRGDVRIIDAEAGETCTVRETAIALVGPDGHVASAADSDLLDGKDSTDFLGATAKAADADKLDGFDSSQLVSNTCSTGYTSDGAICWENLDECCFTLAQAANRCRAQGARLPLLSEFMALRLSGVALGSSLLLDWTASSEADDSSIYINNASSDNMDGARANSTSSWARCVKAPVNALGSP